MSNDSIDWPKLVKGVREKNSEATNDFILSLQEPIFKFCIYLTGNQQLAEDICHDALVKALTSIQQLRNPAQAKAWVKQIARNQFLDYCKAASQSKAHIGIEDAETQPELSIGSEASDRQILAMEALQTLEELDRSLVILVDIEGHTYSEVAEMTKLNEGTVKSKLFRAREKMSKFLGTKRAPRSSNG